MNTAFDPSELLVPVSWGVIEVNELEAANIRAAVSKHLFAPPPELFDLSFLLALHRDMFGEVWKWAGVLRKQNLNIGRPWETVETALYEVTLNLPYWSAQPLVEQCARLHHQLVLIHPFKNGNGRWARLASDIWAVRRGGTYFHWPSELTGTESPARGEYIAALKAADADDLNPLLDLLRRYSAPRTATERSGGGSPG